MSDEASSTERILDLVLYAPVGLALEAGELLPRLVTRGRTQIEGHVNLAKVVGMFAVRMQRAELDKRLQSLRCRQQKPEERAGTAAKRRERPRPVPPRQAEGPVAAAPATTASDAPDVDSLAIPDYDSLAASQVVPRLAGLSGDELEAVRRYEEAHRGRKTILARIAQLKTP